MSTRTRFDILKREDSGSFVWLEAAHDLAAAESRLREISIHSPGEYFVFDQITQQIAARHPDRPGSN